MSKAKNRRLGFVLPPELADEALATIAKIRADPAEAESRKALVANVLRLTDAGLRAYYVEPLERAGVGVLGLATAKLGIRTARQGISTIANKLLGGMKAEQLLSIADSMESMLVHERE